jgi:hypothetical protein
MRRIVEVIALIASTLPAYAQRGYPQIETVFPGAVTRGRTTEVEVSGHFNFRDPVRVVFDSDGITATIERWKELPEAKGYRKTGFPRHGVTMKVTVAEDAVPGIRPFRIVTKGSLSTAAYLLITDAPSVDESEPNNTIAQAQTIEIPHTVNGRLDEEADTDIYKFQAHAGERVSFIIHAARLQKPVPYLTELKSYSDITLTLRDAQNRELAVADDWLGEDPQLFYTFQKDGVYYLELSEARYQSGKDKWWYALSVLMSPHVVAVFPPVVPAGKKTKAELLGFNLDGLNPFEVDAPGSAQRTFNFVAKSKNGGSNVTTVGLSDLPQLIEPPHSGPVAIQLPVGINGRISADGEVDRYRFHAGAGERLEFEVTARQLGSPLDSLIEIRDSKARLLDANDDRANTVGYDGRFAAALAIPPEKDSRLEWRAPADGEYEIAVRDANYFGGKYFVYYLAIRRQKPDFMLMVDDDRLPIGPGESATCVVTVERRNGFQGPIKLFARGLPAGVMAMESTIPAHLDQGNIVLTAAADAKPDARVVTIGGSSGGMERIAKPHSPMGSVNGKFLAPVSSMVVAVTEAADIIVEAEPKNVTLRPGESVTINLHVKRNGYKGPIELNVISWNLTQEFSKLPKGVVFDDKRSKTSLAENETEGRVTYRALPDAPPLDSYLMTVIGQIVYNRVFMTRSAAPLRMTVTPTMVSRK